MTRDGPMWDPGLWEGIREAMREETERAAAARQFLPRVIVGSDVTSIVSQGFAWDGDSGRINRANETLSIMEEYADFKLTAQQVEREDSFHEGRAAALNLARLLARTEDWILFYGDTGNLPPDVVRPPMPNHVSLRDGNAAFNLLSTATRPPIHTAPKPAGRYEEKIVNYVEEAISNLQDHEYYGPYALVLPPARQADAKSPIEDSLALPIELIARDVEWVVRTRLLVGAYQVQGEPPRDLGLVVSLGGDTMDLVVPNEHYEISFVQVDGDGLYVFRISHRLVLRMKRIGSAELLTFPTP